MTKLWSSNHPRFKKNRRNRLNFCIGNPTKRDIFEGRTAYLSEFKSDIHPDIYLFPRDQHLHIIDDEWKDTIALYFPTLPFSSWDFWVDMENACQLWEEILRTPIITRMTRIRQLGFLVPPIRKAQAYYLFPAFIHSRWQHSLLVGAMAEVLLARMGMKKKERDKIVLAFVNHDVAMPAGGDSVIRVDKKILGEEENFSWQLQRFGLDKRWEELFGFDLEEAQDWVLGKGIFGKLLDFLDRISYTALDCCHLLRMEGEVPRLKAFIEANPLVCDVWQEIGIENGEIFFQNTQNLYNFLLMRAFAWLELYRNPAARPLDILIYKETKKLYDAGKIDRKTLLTIQDEELFSLLESQNGCELSFPMSASEYDWKKFRSTQKADDFALGLEEKLYYIEEIKPLKTGLHWPVLHKGKVIPIKEALSAQKVHYLEQLSKLISGIYVYWFKK